MKSFCTFLGAAVLIVVTVPAHAQVALDATTGVRSKYTLSEVGIVVHDKPVIQGDLWWTLPEGLWADIWYSTDFQARENFGREIDYGFGWSGEYAMAGVYYFDLLDQFGLGPVGDIAMLFVQTSTSLKVSETQRITPLVKVSSFFATENAEGNNGAFSYAGVDHDWTMLEVLGFHQDVALIYDGSVFGSDHGFLVRYQAALSAHLADWLTIRAPHFRVHSPLSDSIEDRKTEPVVGLDIIIHHTFVEAPQE